MSHPNILCIDTSLEVCSAAVGKHYIEERGHNIHSSRLNLIIEELMRQAGLSLPEIDAVCIDRGPGSYTGLRIGVSTAKGLAYSLEKPLISINTLQTMAAHLLAERNEFQGYALLCPLIDARRMEVYYALFGNTLHFITDTAAAVVDENFLMEYLKDNKIFFFGNGAEKCRTILSNNPNAIFIEEEIYPSAKNMMTLAEAKFNSKEFEDIFSFEPFYLKDFYIQSSVSKDQLTKLNNSTNQ